MSSAAEDTIRRRGLLAEHRFSALVEWEDNLVLFDTGRVNFSYPTPAPGVQDLKIAVDNFNRAEKPELLLRD